MHFTFPKKCMQNFFQSLHILVDCLTVLTVVDVIVIKVIKGFAPLVVYTVYNIQDDPQKNYLKLLFIFFFLGRWR